MDGSTAHLISWSESTKGDIPPQLTGPSITISPLPSPEPPTIFLFGGKNAFTKRLTNEMWALDLSTRVWRRIDPGHGPAPRYFHSMDVWENKLVCLGGMCDTDPISVFSDIWFFDCYSQTWLPQPSPARELGAIQDPNMMPTPRYAQLSAVSRDKLFVSGGQDSDNNWLYEVNVYDLRKRIWISKTLQPESQGLHSKGAYRSIAASSTQRVITPNREGKTAQSYSLEEEGGGGDIMCYSNYDFSRVRREVEIISPVDTSQPSPPPTSRYVSPPGFAIRDVSTRMESTQLPGLRFPTGGIVGNHFIVCGLYLTQSSATYTIWSLNMETNVWRQLQPSVLASGSWNRAIVWPERAKILVFGNMAARTVDDYERRGVNFDHIGVVSLETYGIYRPPVLELPANIQEVGLSMLNEKLASDFEVTCEDGRRIKCSRKLLSDRWAWFAEQEAGLASTIDGIASESPAAIDINDSLLGNFTSATLTATTLNIPEPFPVCVALVQYFYTLSLSTPLQNRAPVLSALLFLARQYKIERLGRLVVHALHERLEPSVALGVYEIATLAGEQGLQVRAVNMLHASKTSASSRGGQGPTGSVPADSAGRSKSPGPGNYTTQPNGQPENKGQPPTQSRYLPDEGSQRRARAESPTLPDLPDERADQVNSLLAALNITDRHTATHYPIPRRDLPPQAPPPTSGLPVFPRTPELLAPSSYNRPASPSNSDATSISYPATPAGSIRESTILPPHIAFDPRSSAGSGHNLGLGLGLPPLPEDPRTDDRGNDKREGRWLDPSTLEAAGLINPTLRTDIHNRAPPQALSSFQAQAISALQTQNIIHPNQHQIHQLNNHTLTRSTSLINQHHQQQYQYHHQHTQSNTSNINITPADLHRYSMVTQASNSSTEQEQAKQTLHGSINGSIDMTTSKDRSKGMHGSINGSFDIELGSQSQVSLAGYQSRMRSGSLRMKDRGGEGSFVDTMSIDSGSTGNSEKRAAKLEKQAIQAAEKAARKAEQTAKFEAMRADQMHKMCLAKAEVQRKVEAAKHEEQAPKIKPKPKTKFGKFGQKFQEAVLFPQGGGNSTMF